MNKKVYMVWYARSLRRRLKILKNLASYPLTTKEQKAKRRMLRREENNLEYIKKIVELYKAIEIKSREGEILTKV
jgi:hypothetical protein